ncbi:succinylglutamate desuccinylase [Burkholderia sp. WAC0059]|uniref:succinylglutamate desuccinylase n=1 Tax=Burkholderia sp. WAC0059 TaxID=2066022 RepID=UPI000C7EDACA|nr:succinylglutamate desuccinylase [Burkholderia sp. WAC0059]PLZ04387.1 succinylglutamate desuccinylase [Burkholderia sp. WAC0059]
MTFSAELANLPALLADFVGGTLAGTRPAPGHERGECARGVRWRWLDEGVLQFDPGPTGLATRSVIVSAGIHGDETAPIELLSRLVRDLACARASLSCRLLVVLGNVAAMRAGRRYLDDDLNRLFGGRHERLSGSREAPRAATLERMVRRFFDDAPAGQARWHLDMHTAIRASLFEPFALLPHTGALPSRAMFAWLGEARVAAVLVHTEKGATWSHFTAGRCGTLACTLELGRARPFGQNDLTRFEAADRAVRGLLAGCALAGAGVTLPRVFTVTAQITKHSEAFELELASDVPNFTPFARGTLLARDGDHRYVAGHDEERIVFPNPAVKPGLRAGLLVVETTADTLASLA